MLKKVITIAYNLCILCCMSVSAQQNKNATIKFHVLVLAENGGHHIAFTKAAKPWLDKLAADSSFAIDYIENPNNINDTFLSKYQLFIQLTISTL